MIKNLTNISSFLPIITLIIGSIGTLIVNTILSTSRERHEVTLKIIDEFLKMRKSINKTIGKISTLATSNLIDPSDKNKVDKLRRSVSRLFYTYYDLMPRSSLDDLVCLFYSLGDPNGRIYAIKNDSIKALRKNEDIVAAVKSISYYINEKIYDIMSIKINNNQVRYNGVISFHARKILFSFSRSLSMKNLIQWTRHPVKLTLNELNSTKV